MDCLPLTKTEAESWRAPRNVFRNLNISGSTDVKLKHPGRRRIMDTTDLFDSEESNDTFLSLPTKGETTEKSDTDFNENSNTAESVPKSDETVKQCENRKKTKKYDRAETFAASAVGDLSDMYDNFSMFDTFKSKTRALQKEGPCHRCLRPGRTNGLVISGQSETKIEDVIDYTQTYMIDDISCLGEFLTVTRTNDKLGKYSSVECDNDMEKLHEMLSLPVERLDQNVRLRSERTDLQR